VQSLGLPSPSSVTGADLLHAAQQLGAAGGALWSSVTAPLAVFGGDAGATNALFLLAAGLLAYALLTQPRNS
jgi:hypothetical protein